MLADLRAKLRRTFVPDQLAQSFDREFYLGRNPDVRASGLDPLDHFLRYGWAEGRRPSPDDQVGRQFDAVLRPSLLPFRKATRAPIRPAVLRPVPPPAGNEPSLAGYAAAIRAEFDADYYRRNYPTLAADADPVLHYLDSGWKAGLDPSAEFSTAHYLQSNPDVRDSGVNPFWHYVVAGRAEGRTPRHLGGHRFALLENLQPIETVRQQWLRHQDPPVILSADEVATAILAARQTGMTRLLFSVGHDNYRKVSGGVQLCIQHEETRARAHGALYVNLHPWQPLPCLAEADDPGLVVLLVEGREIGVTRMDGLTEAARTLAPQFADRSVVIHHLLGHAPEKILLLMRALQTRRCTFWLHDFFALCTSYTLQRNSLAFCAAPDGASNACMLCIHGKTRAEHQRRMGAFFEAAKVDLISPSEVALDLWKRRSGLKLASARVVPHLTLRKVQTRGQAAEDPSAPIRIAFVGAPALHKGWHDFTRLHARLQADPRFEFLYFGTNAPPAEGIAFVPVSVTAEHPDAMARAIRDHRVDVVLHWPSWFETFSFSTMEALSGGALVVTNQGSGNVAATVRALSLGPVLEEGTDLADVFVQDQTRKMILANRKARARHRYRAGLSEMSFAALDAGRRP